MTHNQLAVFTGTTRSVLSAHHLVIDIALGFDDLFARRKFMIEGVVTQADSAESCKHALIILAGGNTHIAVTVSSTHGETLYGELYTREKIKGRTLTPTVELPNGHGPATPISPILRGIIAGTITIADIRETLNG
jgi:hypothetical protein